MFCSSSSDDEESGPNGLVHRKLEDIVYNKVHGNGNLFEVSLACYCTYIK